MNRRKIGFSLACCLQLTGLGYAQQIPYSVPVYPSFQPVLPTTLSATPVTGPTLSPWPQSQSETVSSPTLLPVTSLSPTPGFNYVVPAGNQPKEIPKTIGPAPQEIPAAPAMPTVPTTPMVPAKPAVPSRQPSTPSGAIPQSPSGGLSNPVVPPTTLSPTTIGSTPSYSQPNSFVPSHPQFVPSGPLSSAPLSSGPFVQSGPIVANSVGNCQTSAFDTGVSSGYVSGPFEPYAKKHLLYGWGLGHGLLSHLFCQDPCSVPLPCVWGSAEFLNWSVRGSSIPTLVISGPPGIAVPINSPFAREEYGGSILGGVQSGIRARAGVWLDSTEGFGLDFGFIWLAESTENYVSNINSVRSLSRPVFNTLANENQTVVIDNDPTINGQIAIASRSSFWGGEANTRQVLINTGCFRLDGYLGYRYLNLTDEMEINQVRATYTGSVSSHFLDRFETMNQFHGGQIGLISELNQGRFSIGVRGGVALGFTFTRTTIDGFSQVGGNTINSGVLAQSSNIGESTINRFTVIPHVGGTVGFDLNRYMRIFGGYDLMIWSNPTRVGGVIDTALNPSILPGNGPLAGAPRPINPNTTSTYWLHGWSAGIQFKW